MGAVSGVVMFAVVIVCAIRWAIWPIVSAVEAAQERQAARERQAKKDAN